MFHISTPRLASNISYTKLCEKTADTDCLVLIGCGGNLDEWVEGIQGMLTTAGCLSGILSEVYYFKRKGLTCLAFPLSARNAFVIDRLAMWRISDEGLSFNAKWLSDIQSNRVLD